MNILIVGSGGREHALIWKIKKSPLATDIYCAPGNGGIAQVAECVNIKAENIDGLVKFVKRKKIDLTIVGPEAPLVEGIVDTFEKNHLKIFGPGKKAAQLEGSKIFAKEFMHRCNIPTAVFKIFNNIDKAREFLSKAQFPLVVKADGLAAGKGVILCENIEQAEEALERMMGKKEFKEAGERIVIEECLQGDEVSVLVVCDGKHYKILEPSQDHKRIFDDDIGPNTGGMGAYSPAPIVNEEMLKVIEARVIDPTLRGMKREGNPFKGVLYVGLMVTDNGPFVLEYNVRFGDPEIQAILPRMKSDFLGLLSAACDGKIHDVELVWEKKACVCVVISSGGYPGEYEKGLEITGIESIKQDDETIVFHAGTKYKDGSFFTAGGRVLGVSGLGKDIEKAIEHTYKAVEKIKFDRCFFRRDIGTKALASLAVKSRVTSTG